MLSQIPAIPMRLAANLRFRAPKLRYALETIFVLQSEDVLVDIRGNILLSHKNQGIWVLRYTGE